MQRQFTLWQSKGPRPAVSPIWENLDEPMRARLIAALAKLISKATSPRSANTHLEDHHER
jgi:hypothetical protein